MVNVGDTFVSYHHSDLQFVRRLVGGLQDAGITVWFDRALDGGPAEERIEAQLYASHIVVFVCSTHTSESNWVGTEISRAIEHGKLIYVIRFKDARIPFRLDRYPRYDVQQTARSDERSINQCADTALCWLLSILIKNVFQPLGRTIGDLRDISHPFLRHVAWRILAGFDVNMGGSPQDMQKSILALKAPTKAFGAESEWAGRLTSLLHELAAAGTDDVRRFEREVRAVCGDKNHKQPEIQTYEDDNVEAAQELNIKIRRAFVASHQEFERGFSADRSRFIRRHSFDKGPAGTPQLLQGKVILDRTLEIMAGFGLSPDVGFAHLALEQPIAIVHVKPNNGCLATQAWEFNDPGVTEELKTIWDGLWRMGTNDWEEVEGRLHTDQGIDTSVPGNDQQEASEAGG